MFYSCGFYIFQQGCAARNVHGFTQEDIEKMSKQWEEAPSLYLQLDVKVCCIVYLMLFSIW